MTFERLTNSTTGYIFKQIGIKDIGKTDKLASKKETIVFGQSMQEMARKNYINFQIALIMHNFR